MAQQTKQQGKWFVIVLLAVIGAAILTMIVLPPLANRVDAVCRFTGGEMTTIEGDRACVYSEGAP